MKDLVSSKIIISKDTSHLSCAAHHLQQGIKAPEPETLSQCRASDPFCIEDLQRETPFKCCHRRCVLRSRKSTMPGQNQRRPDEGIEQLQETERKETRVCITINSSRKAGE